ncbi:GNAT family N-acetyltransferase [Francisella adeliensis]|uniref:GNAT family N-acetyltransferase n=1 Tax=Francisella adeliensis TaxID=2007306 RepID=UPI0019074449|nr:GNAT family protein [Francisella adeliensis]
MIIKTQRLVLRDFRLADTEAYCSMVNDKKYQRFYSEEDCSEEKARKLVNIFLAQSLEKCRSKYQMVIELNGTFIGTAGLRIELNKQASIGCGVGREYQIEGYAEEAIRAILEYGFNKHNLHRIYAETISENKPAIKLCERVEMREEAVFIENRYFKGRWWSTVIMAILKSEWKQTCSKHY